MNALSCSLVLWHPVFPWEGSNPSWFGTIVLILMALAFLAAVLFVIYFVIKTVMNLIRRR